jgi:hypothetical protein
MKNARFRLFDLSSKCRHDYRVLYENDQWIQSIQEFMHSLHLKDQDLFFDHNDYLR